METVWEVFDFAYKNVFSAIGTWWLLDIVLPPLGGRIKGWLTVKPKPPTA